MPQWLLIKARGVWSHKAVLTADQWAFAQFHIIQDLVDEGVKAKATLQEEMALHYLVKVNPEVAKRAILQEPLNTEGPSAEEEKMIELTSDPYFGDFSPLPLPPILNPDHHHKSPLDPPPFGEPFTPDMGEVSGAMVDQPMHQHPFPGFPVPR